MSKNDGGSGSDYEVGHGKPPKHSRYKKGQSGNSKGRPKKKKAEAPGREEFRKAFFEVMNSDVLVRINGTETKMSTMTALFHQMRSKALSGDYRSLKLLLGQMEGNIKIEEVMREAEENRLPTAVTIEFVSSDGNGKRRRYDKPPGDPNRKELPLDEHDLDKDDDAWLD